MTRPARPWLWPLAPAYRLTLALRAAQLRTGLMPVRRLRWPVVSVGNLAVGGAGKTPLAIALAQALAARGICVDVLSRGYGRPRSTPPLRVDPHGDAERFGDEPLVIARVVGVPVFVAPDRYQAGLLAERSGPSGSGLHLLDDGFQHRRLHRDLDILLLSRRDLADHLLPAGNLREPLHAAARASVFAIPQDEPDVADWIGAQGWERPVWRLSRRMDVPPCDGPVVAFCGIARPHQFFAGLERAGLRIAARFAFADHHRYSAGDLQRIAAAARGAHASLLLTTEKDRARLGSLSANLSAGVPLQAVPLRICIDNESEAIAWLVARLQTIAGRPD